MKKIILVEDEKDLNSLIKTYLEKAGYEVVSYLTGEDALNDVNIDAHLWILDIMLGGDISGFDLLKSIREVNNSMPIIFTSARDKDLDKILGLELGCDDYITKPYSPKELVLRVNNLIKRVYDKDLKRIIYEEYVIDVDKRVVYLNDKNLNLTTLEFDLLYMFITNKDKLFYQLNENKYKDYTNDVLLIVEAAKKSLDNDLYSCSNELDVSKQDVYYIPFDNAASYFDVDIKTSPFTGANYQGYIMVINSNEWMDATSYYIAVDDSTYGIEEVKFNEVENAKIIKNNFALLPDNAVICRKNIS